jgi:hypothetical protein
MVHHTMMFMSCVLVFIGGVVLGVSWDALRERRRRAEEEREFIAMLRRIQFSLKEVRNKIDN